MNSPCNLLHEPTNTQNDKERENSMAQFQNPARRSSNANDTHQNGSQYAPRLVKIDFPRFSGEEDTTSWFCRVE